MTQRQQVQVRLETDIAQWLEDEARRRMVSKTLLVQRALEELREREQVAA